MLQVLRAPPAAPRLERRARRMVVAQPRHTRRALARLSTLLRGQAAQARVCPGSRPTAGPPKSPNQQKCNMWPWPERGGKREREREREREDTPVKTRQIADGVVDRHEAEGRSARLGMHCARDVPVREADLEAVRP